MKLPLLLADAGPPNFLIILCATRDFPTLEAELRLILEP